MSWSDRFLPNRVGRFNRHDSGTPAGDDAALDGALGFIAAVYGIALTPSDPLVVSRLGQRGSTVVAGATLEQLAGSAGDVTARTCRMLVDHLPFAVVIADATARVLLANAPALHALRLGQMIASRDGRVHTADPVASGRLRSAIAQACAPQGSDLPVLVPTAPEAPWCHVAVIGVERGGVRFAAVLFPDSQRLNGVARIMTALFSFTAAEARMAVLVLEGRTLTQAASALGIRTRTALETWRNVRLKLRTRTDSECLRVLGGALLVTEPADTPTH